MELLQLEYFEKVAKFNSVSKAATELCISQSSLSGCILRLEKELGVPLFERKHRKMILTNYGEYFLSVTREILRLLSTSRLSFDAQLPVRLSIAFLNFSEDLLRIIHRFQTQNPHVEFSVYGSTMAAPTSINSFDFVVCNANVTLNLPMNRLHVMSQGYSVVLPKAHPLSRKKSLDLPELQKESFCFLQKESGRLEAAYQFCIDSGFIPKCVFTTNNAYYKSRYLSYGSAVSLIPNGLAGAFESFPNLAVVPLNGYEHSADIWFCWSKDRPLSGIAQNFLTFVQESLDL